MRDVIAEYEAVRVRSPMMGKWEYANRICKLYDSFNAEELALVRRHLAAKITEGNANV